MSALNFLKRYFDRKIMATGKTFWYGRYARTGGEANSIAIRIARASSGKDKVAICGYHGWHDWYLSMSIVQISLGFKTICYRDFQLLGAKNLKNTNFPFYFNDFRFKNICDNHDIGVIKMKYLNIHGKKFP